MMKSSTELQKDVQNSIEWEPLLKAAEISVTVKDGIVTLAGIVDNYAKKSEAEDAAKKVAGVKAVIENIRVKLAHWGQTTDEEVAAEVLRAFRWNWKIPNNEIKVKVEQGLVTLEGELHWNYQKEAVTAVIKNLWGVTGISNNLTIKSETEKKIYKSNIENAFRRNWLIAHDKVQITVSGNVVTLSGKVNSLYKKEEAEQTAWDAPGVWSVTNNIDIVTDTIAD